MSTAAAQPTTAAPGAARDVGERASDTRVPLCFIVDGDASIRHFLSLVLHGTGIDTEEFADGQAFRAALARRAPDLVFLNIPLESTDAIECVIALGKKNCNSHVQLMSSRGLAVLEHVKSIGQQHRLQMLPALKKPFETAAVLKIIDELKLGNRPGMATRLDLGEALNKGWIEFWYQPKIDLRKKQLIGVEAFARARHPQNGVLMPDAFMPGASDAALVKLSEETIDKALQTGLKFASLGIHLQLAINVQVSALTKTPIADIVQTYRSKFERWAGLIIDVSEEQILTELDLANEVTKKLSPLNVNLAIDNFGRGYPSLMRLKELPFAELKLDRAFVVDCGSDKVNAPLCKTVIDLAHNFGRMAVAIGIEKASDALALVSMGCDYGQGFLLGQPMPEDRFISLLRQRAASQGRQLSPEHPAPAPPETATAN
jgi:EAL domain-containing protein (putative c-di-GMP-specific phosphodiesterase class I)